MTESRLIGILTQLGYKLLKNGIGCYQIWSNGYRNISVPRGNYLVRAKYRPVLISAGYKKGML